MIIIFNAFFFVKKNRQIARNFPGFFYSFFAFLLLRVVTPLV